MKDFKAALSTLPVTQPIFRLLPDVYSGTTLQAQAMYSQTWLIEDTDSTDLKLAKELFKEEYDRDSRRYNIDYYGAERALQEEIASYLLRFLREHLPQKHPKNTKLYKFTERVKHVMQQEDAAAEAYYSTYKYLWTNQAIDQLGTNIHVQNGLKILETLRNRFEKEPK